MTAISENAPPAPDNGGAKLTPTPPLLGAGGLSEVRILLTGGGTGGHVSPVLATVAALYEIANEADWTPVFLYVGSESGIEKKMAADACLPFFAVQSGKLRRAKSVRGMLTLANLHDLMRVPVGVGQAMGAVRRFRPHAVFATGGYVSVPPVLAAAALHVPVLVHEQTARVGLANRIAAHFASRVALSVAGSEDGLPPRLRQKAWVTGNPVRELLFGGDRERAIMRFGFTASNPVPCVFVTGGAQGAQAVNRAVEDSLPELLTLCRVVHQCGRTDVDRLTAVRDALPPAQKARYFVTAFMDDEIADAYALADIVVGRSGAGTVAEVCALGKCAVLVPLVPTSGDEQTKNARRLSDAGAAVLLPGTELSPVRLRSEVQSLLADPARREQMGKAASSFAWPSAAHDLAGALLALAGINWEPRAS